MLGQPPAPDKLGQYLEAYFGDSLSSEAVDVVSHSKEESLDAIKAKLQRIYSQVCCVQPSRTTSELTAHWQQALIVCPQAASQVCRDDCTVARSACTLNSKP